MNLSWSSKYWWRWKRDSKYVHHTSDYWQHLSDKPSSDIGPEVHIHQIKRLFTMQQDIWVPLFGCDRFGAHPFDNGITGRWPFQHAMALYHYDGLEWQHTIKSLAAVVTHTEGVRATVSSRGIKSNHLAVALSVVLSCHELSKKQHEGTSQVKMLAC